MRKVVMVAPVPPPYGGITNWVQLLDGYAQRGSDIEFIHVDTAAKSRGIDGRTMWDRIVVSGLDMLRKNKQLLRVISREQPDVIHMTTSGQLALIRDNLMLKTAVRKKISTVYHIHFGRAADIAERNTTEWKLLKAAVLKADVTIAIDLSTYDVLRANCPQSRIVFVPNPVDISALPEPGKMDKIIAYLGWIIPKKGINELLTAWDNISKRYPDWKLKLIGPYQLEYRQELEEHHCMKCVEWTGELPHDQAMAEICGCGVFTLPSYTEGFPNAVVEAMALGRPIVASAVGAIPNMLSNGCGKIIPPRNVQALQEALEEVLAEEKQREDMGELARVKAIEMYEIGIVFDQYKKLWNNPGIC